MQRLFFGLAIAAAALATSLALAGDQATTSSDQQLANQVKASLCSGQLHHYAIDVKVAGGTCWLNGTVTNRQQLDTALDIVAETAGIEKVVNGLKMTQPSAQVVQVSASPEPTMSAQLAIGAGPVENPTGTVGVEAHAVGAPRPLAMARAQPLPGAPGCAPAYGPNGMGGGMSGGPIPAYAPGAGGGIAPAHFDRANMPGYAWPSYAAYPNYASITYPRQYSPTAWPFIGPFYPYPQVPLGWRKVTLEWHNGWWNLDFKDGDGGCH
ncbi:MAG TPA: BON domain-containing protein [Pirellulales bacterium]|nr:BON domain-containing protein [Pirellulales bacterium]